MNRRSNRLGQFLVPPCPPGPQIGSDQGRIGSWLWGQDRNGAAGQDWSSLDQICHFLFFHIIQCTCRTLSGISIVLSACIVFRNIITWYVTLSFKLTLKVCIFQQASAKSMIGAYKALSVSFVLSFQLFLDCSMQMNYFARSFKATVNFNLHALKLVLWHLGVWPGKM